MVTSIPASAIVNVTPAVVSPGGSGLDMTGLILTNSGRVPIGSVAAFATADLVAAYFGPLSQEAQLATVYFAGFDNSQIKPAQILFAQCPTSDVPGYLRGGRVSSSLDDIKAMSGTITIQLYGESSTSANINLATATSFSDAAIKLQAAIKPGIVTVYYDSIAGAFVLTTAGNGPTASISYASGTLAPKLKLDAASGAVLSQGAGAATPAAAMTAIVASTQNFVSFMTAFKPSVADMLGFAAWSASKGNRYLYVMWDNDVAATGPAGGSTAGAQVMAANLSGVCPIYDPGNGATIAAFTMGAIASVDFARLNGRSTIALKSQAGLLPGVTNQGIANQLIAYGYNFYGAYATANSQFMFLYPGSVTGPVRWIDSFINQIWINNGFQLSLMTLMTSIRSVPYNAVGYAMIEAALADVIDQATDFGAIRAGVRLSQVQVAQVNTAAGLAIDQTLFERGWYVQVLPADAATRAARSSPIVNFWYVDGQSIQRIALNSIEVQ